MSVAATAAACAARSVGYPGLAEIIVERQLSPGAVADLLTHYGARRNGMTVAVIVLAASTARHRVDPHRWNGEAERLLALDALKANDAAFRRACSRAAKIVAEHWPEIATEA